MGVLREQEPKLPAHDRFSLARAMFWATLALIVMLGYAVAGLAAAGVIQRIT